MRCITHIDYLGDGISVHVCTACRNRMTEFFVFCPHCGIKWEKIERAAKERGWKSYKWKVCNNPVKPKWYIIQNFTTVSGMNITGRFNLWGDHYSGEHLSIEGTAKNAKIVLERLRKQYPARQFWVQNKPAGKLAYDCWDNGSILGEED